MNAMDTVPSADFVLGFDAQWSGMPVTACPYDRVFERDKWLEWRRGWMGGQSAEDGSRVHYVFTESRVPDRPSRAIIEEFANDPDVLGIDLVGHKGDSFIAPLALPPLPPPPFGLLNTGDEPGTNFKPRSDEQPWRDDRNDPPEGGWDEEPWKKGPQG